MAKQKELNKKILYVTSPFQKGVTAPDSDGSITIKGYANTNAVDRQGDIIPSVVWEEGMTNYMKNPIILAYHDYEQPIGRMTDSKVDSTGLWVQANISKAAGNVYELIKDEVLTAFSVGFQVLDATYDSTLDLFIIKELELLEISVVAVPANQDSLFSLAKSFESEEDCLAFKKQYAKVATLDNSQDANSVNNQSSINKGIIKMDEKELAALVAKAAADAVAQAEEKRIAAEKAAKDAADAEKALQAKIDAAVSAATATIQVGASGAEKLLAEVTKRFEDESAAHKSALEGLHAEIKAKAHELEVIQKSKMTFSDNKVGADGVSYEDKEKAVILSTMSGKSMQETAFGRQLLEKAGPHVPGAVPWEQEVSFNMEYAVRRKLVVAAQIRSIAMQTNVMKIPLNPDAGVATWIQNSQFGGVPATLGAAGPSAGVQQTHQLQEITLSAYKVATNEYVTYEEQEDSLIVLVPIIRDAMVRRVARAVDIAFLRGAGAGADPVKGLANYASGAEIITQPLATPPTVATLRNMRQQLAYYGLDPAEVTFIVSTEVYYDLLNDTTFQPMNQVGPQATLITGQIGQIGNSPVLVSGEFATKGTGAVAAIAFNTANFLAGNQRGLRIDTGELVETQRRVLVASLRTGMTQLTTSMGDGVSALVWGT